MSLLRSIRKNTRFDLNQLLPSQEVSVLIVHCLDHIGYNTSLFSRISTAFQPPFRMESQRTSFECRAGTLRTLLLDPQATLSSRCSAAWHSSTRSAFSLTLVLISYTYSLQDLGSVGCLQPDSSLPILHQQTAFPGASNGLPIHTGHNIGLAAAASWAGVSGGARSDKQESASHQHRYELPDSLA